MRDHLYRILLEHPAPHEGYYTLAGTRHGPFASPEESEVHLLEVLRAWDRRARELGGWVHRRTAVEVVVTLPEHVPVEGAEPPRVGGGVGTAWPKRGTGEA